MPPQASNLGPDGVRLRLLAGVVGLGIALVGALAVHFMGLDRWWRLSLFVPFWIAGLGLLQAWERT